MPSIIPGRLANWIPQHACRVVEIADMSTSVEAPPSLAVSSLITNQVAKRLWRRKRPSYQYVPLLRRLRKHPKSNSLPSGHAASAAAFTVGVGLENPTLGLLIAPLANQWPLTADTGEHVQVDHLRSRCVRLN
jgi:hypothetical protein